MGWLSPAHRRREPALWETVTKGRNDLRSEESGTRGYRSLRVVLIELVDAADAATRPSSQAVIKRCVAEAIPTLGLSGAPTTELDVALAFEAGLVDVVASTGTIDQILIRLRAIGMGTSLMTRDERERLKRALDEHRQTHLQLLEPLGALSLREQQVLSMLMLGRTVGEIAATQFVSVATVRTHVQAILTKLEVHHQLGAVIKAINAKWELPVGREHVGSSAVA